jgi:DNA-binding response OmpR family regulator
MTARLLIADSDPSLCEIYAYYLSVHDFEVQTASDGIECLERARAFQPDALLLEWELLWGGGDGVLARLQEEFFGGSPRVVVTSDQPADEIFPYFPAPVVECVRKPFRLASILPLFRGEPAASARLLCRG